MVGNSSNVTPLTTEKSAMVGNLIRGEQLAEELGDGADLVVALLVGQLGLAQSFQQWRHVHAETAAVALPEAVPAANRIVFRAAPRLNGALLGGLLFIGGAEVDPVALFDKPGVQVVDASELIPQLGRSDLAEERRRVGGLFGPHRVGRGSRGQC